MEAADGGRDVAVVLSGGSVNGVLMELGFLQRLRESPFWPRVGWIFGTSSGALAGALAALDRLDDLERFLLALRPEDTFRPQSLWRLPFVGVFDFTLPQTIADGLGEPVELARGVAASPIELVVCATDVSNGPPEDGPRAYELVYSSRTTPPEVFAQAALASAAISPLVLPIRVGDRIATDGGWVRNYPLAYAYDHPEVAQIVAFRYLPQYRELDAVGLAALRARLERFERVPPIRALVAELREAEARYERGEPTHLVDTLLRVMRIAVQRNTILEEQRAREKDESIGELAALRADVTTLVLKRGGRRGRELARLVDERFAAARFPFRHDRLVPRITVQGTAGEVSLEPGFRTQREWTVAAKRSLIRRGYAACDRELRAAGSESDRAAAAS